MLKPTSDASTETSPDAGQLSVRSLFDAEETNLLRYAFLLTGRRAIAEEIVQEVFLQLHAKWDEVESPQAWLFRSVRNRAFNHLRKAKRESLQGNDDMQESTANPNEQTADAAFERMESAAALRKLLSELGETDQQLVNLKYFEGLKYREISDRTGLTIGNVGYRLHQILRRLASGLQPLGIDQES